MSSILLDALSYMDCVILKLARDYKLNVNDATEAFKNSCVYTNLMDDPEITMHDSIDISAAYVYAEIYGDAEPLIKEKKENSIRPHYDQVAMSWKVKVDGEEIEGSLHNCISKYIGDELVYKLASNDEEYSFDGVLLRIMENPGISNIEGDRDQYSSQEQRIIDKLKEKILANINQE